MKKLISILLLFAVLAVTNVSYAQDDGSSGKNVTIEKQKCSAIVAPVTFQIQTNSDFAIQPVKTLHGVTVYANDYNVTSLSLKCKPSADYGNCTLYSSFPINENIAFKIPTQTPRRILLC